MSHVATVDLEIRDLDALAEAAKRVGLELVRDQHTYRWYGRSVGDFPLPEGFTEDDLGKCEHALRIPPGEATHARKPYEIGVVKRRDGRPGFVLQWDFYAGGYGMQERAGNDCATLRQAYATVVAAKQLRRQGYAVTETTNADGAIILQARGGRL